MLPKQYRLSPISADTQRGKPVAAKESYNSINIDDFRVGSRQSTTPDIGRCCSMDFNITPPNMAKKVVTLPDYEIDGDTIHRQSELVEVPSPLNRQTIIQEGETTYTAKHTCRKGGKKSKHAQREQQNKRGEETWERRERRSRKHRHHKNDSIIDVATATEELSSMPRRIVNEADVVKEVQSYRPSSVATAGIANRKVYKSTKTQKEMGQDFTQLANISAGKFGQNIHLPLKVHFASAPSPSDLLRTTYPATPLPPRTPRPPASRTLSPTAKPRPPTAGLPSSKPRGPSAKMPRQRLSDHKQIGDLDERRRSSHLPAISQTGILNSAQNLFSSSAEDRSETDLSTTPRPPRGPICQDSKEVRARLTKRQQSVLGLGGRAQEHKGRRH